MLGIVKEDSNNNKYIDPLTSDVGAGAPVGTIIAQYKKADPDGYLYLDGSTFDSAQYPALYMYLGTNVLPDYREFALVGAEQNSTDVYDASTNPDGTIHSHDVYTEGEAKDDQLQTHTHKVGMNWSATGNVRSVKDTSTSINAPSYNIPTGEDDARHGTVTRGKRKAVFFYIKATTGLPENQQENVLNTVKNYYEPELLWTNPNPNTAISATTITAQSIGKDLTQFKAIEVVARNVTGGASFNIIKVYKDMTIAGTVVAGTIFGRNFTFADTGIEISNGWYYPTYTGSSQSSDTVIIPQKIYGLR